MKALFKARKQIEQMKDLQNIITTMKNISMVNVTHFERKVRSVRRYLETIEKGLQIFLKTEDPQFIDQLEKKQKEGFSVYVLLGSEKGLSGGFNQKLIRFFEQNKEENGRIFGVGRKISTILELESENARPFPSSDEEIMRLIEELIEKIQVWIDQGAQKIIFYHNQLKSNLVYEPRAKTIFPMSPDHLRSLREKPWKTNQIPTYFLEGQELFFELMQEYFYITIYQVFIESMASENSARLASMQAAETNVEEKLSSFQRSYHQQRQSQITEEIFERPISLS